MKIYVIRHGEVDVNVKGQINSINEIHLNENGYNQAIEASKIVKGLDLDVIFCSPLQRTKDTCKSININNVPVIYEERIIERDAKSMQYQPIDKIDLDLWYDKTKDIIYSDTEGFKSLIARVTDFLNELKSKNQYTSCLLVTHGDTCRAIYVYFNRLKDFTGEDMHKYDQKNCEIVEYDL